MDKSAVNLPAEVELIMVHLFARILCEDMSDRERTLRFDGVRNLQAILLAYGQYRYDDRIYIGIAKKKGEMIMAATTKTEMEAILRPKAPRYDGSKFVSDKYSVPEEELIAWSQTSLRGPLVNAGFERYMKLFCEVFPDEAKSIPEIARFSFASEVSDE